MKYEKFVVPVSVCAAVIAAALAAVVVTNNRASEAENLKLRAKYYKDAAQAETAMTNAAERAASAQLDAETKNLEAQTQANEAEKNRLDADKQEAENLILAQSNLTLKAFVENKRAEAEASAAEKEKNELANRQLRFAEQQAYSNDAIRMAELKLAQTQAEESLLKGIQLKKIDFDAWADRLESWQHELAVYQQELDERERELHPDVSIFNSSNITWVADCEADVIGGGTNRLRRAAVKILPENDLSLPKTTRTLSRTDRIRHEVATNRLASSQATLVGKLEKLRAAAIRDGRVIDAEFYLKSIKSLNPDYQK